MRYFITFSCYGTHLHGDESGSVDRRHNRFGSRALEFDPRHAESDLSRMSQPAYELNSTSREAVLQAIKEVCAHRRWNLLAAHVRTTHVHVVVEANDPPENVMNDFKAYSSRALNQLGLDEPGQRRWARHGSTRWLWKDQDVREAVRYVVEKQGEAMAVFLSGPL